MQQLPIVITATVTLLVLMFLVQNPALSAKPGSLHAAHRSMEKGCTKCHSYFNGLPEGKCLSCHDISKIAERSTERAPGQVVFPFHTVLVNTSCISCHTEHEGLSGMITKTPFKHELVRGEKQNECTACHVAPEDALHNSFGKGCYRCHNTIAWREASFDHTGYFVFDANHPGQCNTCHTDKANTAYYTCYGCHAHKEADVIKKHNGRRIVNVAQCVNCHRSGVFEHDKYFRFDANHPADCKTCHTAKGNYRQYTCYSCHVHAPDRIARKHQKEGIADYENCIRCHRSGNKHDAEAGEGERSKEGGEHGGHSEHGGDED